MSRETSRYRTFILAHDEVAVGSAPDSGRIELIESYQILSHDSPLLDHCEQVDWDGDIHSGRVLAVGVFTDKWETMGRKELEELMANIHDEVLGERVAGDPDPYSTATSTIREALAQAHAGSGAMNVVEYITIQAIEAVLNAMDPVKV